MCLATVVAIILLAAGPWRYTVTTAGVGNAVAAYVLDTWTGSMRLYVYDTEVAIKSLRQQRRDLIDNIRNHARRERDGDTECYVCTTGGYPSEEVLVAPRDLRKFVERHPMATPVL